MNGLSYSVRITAVDPSLWVRVVILDEVLVPKGGTGSLYRTTYSNAKTRRHVRAGLLWGLWS